MNHSNSIRLSATVFALAASLSGQAAHAASASATASITDISTTLLTLANNQFMSETTTAKDAQSAPLHTAFDAGSVLQSYFFNDTAVNGDSAYAEIDNGFAPLPRRTPVPRTAALIRRRCSGLLTGSRRRPVWPP